LYERALALYPSHENTVMNYSLFLEKQGGDSKKIRELLERSATANPRSGRTLLSLANTYLRGGDASRALGLLRQVRDVGANQAAVEASYATALHINGAPIGECIAAYRTGLALNPDHAGLSLNLAQLLFVRGEKKEPNDLLSRALSSGLSDSDNLEAQFYRLAHTDADSTDIIASMRASLAKGGRLKWDMVKNVEVVRAESARRGDLLQMVWNVLRGDEPDALDNVRNEWTAILNVERP
jgi:tetratricopeptide (TPR) repeat protein